MKLGFCPACKDIFKFTFDVRACSCGKCSGVMKDKELVQINGPVKVLGINDKTLYEAIAAQPVQGPGKEFVAFVHPKLSKGVHKIAPPKQTKPIGGS
jgi:hypothetical protein